MDMTPMVDVAFLLLTFFMLSTTMQRHQVIPIPVPESGEKPYPGSSLLTVMVDAQNNLFWNLGSDTPNRITLSGFRNLVEFKCKQDTNLITLLKIDRKARYHSIIDILDELQQSGASKYSVAPLLKEDQEILRTIPS
jgi:biopolymer transport protein ExbD